MASDQQVVDEARGQTTAEVMAIWNSWFAGQFSQSPAVPALTNSQEFDIEGHPLLFRTIGGADGALATIVHVPDLRAICSGDITRCSPRQSHSSPPNWVGHTMTCLRWRPFSVWPPTSTFPT